MIELRAVLMIALCRSEMKSCSRFTDFPRSRSPLNKSQPEDSEWFRT